MKKSLAWTVTDYTICVVNVVLHAAGFLLLLAVYRKKRAMQESILLHLAATQVLRNLAHLIHDMGADIARGTGETPSYKRFHDYMQFMRSVWLIPQFYIMMFIITGERLMKCSLSIRYTVVYMDRVTRIALKAAWAVTSLFTLCFVVYYEITGRNYIIEICYTYVDMILGVTLVPFTFGSYTYLFLKYRDSSLNRRTLSTGRRPTTAALFRNSRFPVAIVVVTSFLLLTVVPDTLFQILKSSKSNAKGKTLPAFIGLSKLLSDTVDAIAYILLTASVRSLLGHNVARLQKVCRRKSRQQQQPRQEPGRQQGQRRGQRQGDVEGIASIDRTRGEDELETGGEIDNQNETLVTAV